MSYNEKKSFRTLSGIIKRTHNDLKEQVIVKKKNGYQAYSEYNITQKGPYWEVTTDFYDDPKVFNMVKSALAWCIAYKASRYELARMIRHLDARLAAKQNDIDFLTERLKYVNEADLLLIMQCRLSEDINNRQSYKQQLANCVKATKYIKIKGSLDNELRRFTKAS